MKRILKNTILNHLSEYIETEFIINNSRIYNINNNPIKIGNIVYLCERELRAKNNFALQFAIQKSNEQNLPIKIIHPKISYKYKPKQDFIDKQIYQLEKMYKQLNLNFQIIKKQPSEILKEIEVAMLIIDFNPIVKRTYLNNADYKIYEIDGHNIVPARYVSNKQEYNAATLRRKIYLNIDAFLTEYSDNTPQKTNLDYILENFIKNKLPYYGELKNDPSKDVLSGLSKYLNLGFISSQRVALEVIKSNVSDTNKEIFLEELIIRKELADNFCLYVKNFKNYSGIPTWAKQTLNTHKYDLRSHNYTIDRLEFGETHDKLWNAAQKQLLKEGRIHGYVRMYWAKKILEWTSSPEEALKISIYLNDKYAFDAPSPNGYTGILWALGGLHDRAFKDYFITGKIRRMSYNSIKKRYNLKPYIEKYL